VIKYLRKSTSRKEIFILDCNFRDLNPRYLALLLWANDNTVYMVGAHGIGDLFTSWQPGKKETKRKGLGSHNPHQQHPCQ
jgi:hypothetical protein